MSRPRYYGGAIPITGGETGFRFRQNVELFSEHISTSDESGIPRSLLVAGGAGEDGSSTE